MSKTIGLSELERLLRFKGTRILTVTIRTEPRLKAPKSNPLVGRLVKMETIQGPTGFSYERAVNRQLEREAEPTDIVDYFRAIQRPWVEYIPGTPLIKHKETGVLYLPLRPDRVLQTQFILDGKEVSLEEIRDYLYVPPAGSGRQGTEKVVPYINVKLTNVVQIQGLRADTIYTLRGNNA